MALFLVSVLTSVMTLIAVAIHHESLRVFRRWMAEGKAGSRFRVLFSVYGLVGVHLLEITLFGFAFLLAAAVPNAGGLGQAGSLSVLDAMFMSAQTYTTLGASGIELEGPIRLLVGCEALVGFLLVTWSASFTYLVMQEQDAS